MKQNHNKLDILINNAAQTIHRPNEFYNSLIGNSIFTSDFPDRVDENGIQVDMRSKNTWVQKISETPNSELLAVTLINYIAPFILIRDLSPLFKNNDNTFIVNVSSMEGKYTTGNYAKTDRHVHNNCAKASLNMLTRSLAFSWKQDNIYVNSVETGWITDEFPEPTKWKSFLPPLDEIDRASRVLDPIFDHDSNNPKYGLFLKDYYRTQW